MYKVLNTGQLYESTSEVQDAMPMYELWDTGQQYVSSMIENVSTDSKLEDRSAFFGWCTSSLGTNVEEDTTGWRAHTDQENLRHGGSHQQQGEDDHQGSVPHNADDGSGGEPHDAIAQRSSFRTQYEQTPFVLEGGGGIVGSEMSSSHEAEHSQLLCSVLVLHVGGSSSTHRHSGWPAAI